MQITVKKEDEDGILLGLTDIAVYEDDSTYMVVRLKNEKGNYRYKLHSISNGYGGATGEFASLEALTNSISQHNIKIYRKEDYKLVIVRK